MSGQVVLRVIVTATALAVAAAFWCWQAWTGPHGDPSAGEMVRVRIPRGASTTAVADSLTEADLLAHRRIFIFGARLSGGDRDIKAGLYDLPRGLAPRELLQSLVAGVTVPVRLTVPEGLTVTETTPLLTRLTGEPDGAVHSAADSLWRLRYGALAGRSGGGGAIPVYEGFLHPETYVFSESVRAAEIVEAQLRLAFDRYDEAREAAGGAAPDLDLYEVFILASIVEAETPLDVEKPKVAAVYLNRLDRNMALEADPTIAFALDKKGQRILYADLEIDSPYNTYRNRGLPPTPICSPGEAALKAVLSPEPDFDALYFVADGRGGHVFSRTFAEHQRAVERFRAIRTPQREAAERD